MRGDGTNGRRRAEEDKPGVSKHQLHQPEWGE